MMLRTVVLLAACASASGFATYPAHPTHHLGRSHSRSHFFLRTKMQQQDVLGNTPETLQAVEKPAKKPLLPTPPPPKDGDFVDIFCRTTNELMKAVVIPAFREKVEMQPAGTAGKDIMSRLTAPPEFPGMSRPLWLVMVGSIPSALIYYGYYKFSVEEELFQDELATEGRVTGCGGYGTLFPFVFATVIGGIMRFLFDIEAGELVIEAGGAWILAGQINLYRRINHLYEKEGKEPPLHAWWAVLPPPIDLIVGLRQVHFLAKYWADRRKEEWETDKVADELFPFISSERFTLKQLARTPSKWFWFTKDAPDFDFPFLKD